MKVKKRSLIDFVTTFATFAMWVLVAGAFMAVVGCDEGMNITDDIIKPVEKPVQPAEPTEPTTNGEVKKPTDPVEPQEPSEPVQPEPEPEPQPTVTISTAVQADDGSVVVSGSSAHVPTGTTITVTLGDVIETTAVTDQDGNWTVTVSAAEVEDLTAGTVTVTAVAQVEIPSISPLVTFEYAPPVEPTDPNTPAWLIPPADAVLSDTEKRLKEGDESIGYDAVTGSMVQTPTGKPADQIGALPYKDREEVYEQFIQFVESEYDLPFFREAAEVMKEVNLQLAKIAADDGIGPAYIAYLDEVYTRQGIEPPHSPVGKSDLADIYFEENPQDAHHQSSGHSYYWIILEYYRIQLEHPRLADAVLNRKAGSFLFILNLFRESVQNGHVFGLDNPWR